jgi:hypothetical protein
MIILKKGTQTMAKNKSTKKKPSNMRYTSEHHRDRNKARRIVKNALRTSEGKVRKTALHGTKGMIAAFVEKLLNQKGFTA